MFAPEEKPRVRHKREDFVIVSTKFFKSLSDSDLSPSELSLLFHLLSRIQLGGNVVQHYSGIEAAAATGLHRSSVSTALTRLEERGILRRSRRGGHKVITVNPNLASRADQRTRADLRATSKMPPVAITRLTRRADRH